MEDIPVFLFTGFLDAGKTSFIESLLEDKEFNNGQPTLVIQCEEGEEELLPDRFPKKGKVSIVTIDSEDRLTEGHLLALTKQYKPARIIVEFNGMWLNNSLFQALPESWSIAGETLFFDSTTFAVYNANMRQLVVDKLRTAELVLFNRVTEETDKMALHKIVRAITRQADIAYSYDSGKTEYDEIVDPLPFDVDAPIVKVEDKDYALFYQDLVEDFKKYHGKVVEFTALVARNNRMPKDTFGRGYPVRRLRLQVRQRRQPPEPGLVQGDRQDRGLLLRHLRQEGPRLQHLGHRTLAGARGARSHVLLISFSLLLPLFLFRLECTLEVQRIEK